MGDNSTFGFFTDDETTKDSKTTQETVGGVSNLAQPTTTSESVRPKVKTENKDRDKKKSSESQIQRYLVFQLGGNKYATPLLAAREVIEVPAFRAIPNTKDYFLGIANLRGEVVGLIDLRKMFGFEDCIHDRSSVILYESESGPLGAMIDEINGVINLDQSDITTEINIKTSVPQKYLMGIGKLPNDELVILLELRSVLEEDDLLSVRSIKESA